jgi:hypothetical protein
MPGISMSSNPVTALLPPPIQEKHTTDPTDADQHPEHPSRGPGIPVPASDHARDATDGQHAQARCACDPIIC